VNRKFVEEFGTELKNFNPKKIVLKLSEVMVGSGIWDPDPGSGKNLFRIPDPGVQKAPDPGSGSATLLTRIRSRIRIQNYLKSRIRSQIRK